MTLLEYCEKHNLNLQKTKHQYYVIDENMPTYIRGGLFDLTDYRPTTTMYGCIWFIPNTGEKRANTK